MAKKKKQQSPLVRRVFPDLFAHKVVGVQPMTSPVGLAYAMRFAINDADDKMVMSIVHIRTRRNTKWNLKWTQSKSSYKR